MRSLRPRSCGLIMPVGATPMLNRGIRLGVLVFTISGCGSAGFRSALNTPAALDAVTAARDRTPLLLLGTFHFAASGDAFKSQVPFDVLTPARQREVEALVERLARFHPTKIAVEALPERQARLDSLYRAYLDGTYALGANEIYQVGFRLARRLGHPRVYAVDARMRSYMDYDTYKREVAALGQSDKLDYAQDQQGRRYTRLFQHDDSAKAVRDLREHLAYLNSDVRMRASVGSDLAGSFRIGRDTNYLGPDWGTQSFNRDLRIFQNLLRLAEPRGERILLIIGASHVPFLRMLGDGAADLKLVRIDEYLCTGRD